MGILNNFEEVHGRNFVLSNIQSRTSYTGRNKPVQCSGFRIQPRQKFRINVETVELVGRAPGIDDYTVVRISTKTCPEIQQGYEEKGIWSGRSGISEGSREYVRCQQGSQCLFGKDPIESPPLWAQRCITWKIWTKDHFLGHGMPIT